MQGNLVTRLVLFITEGFRPEKPIISQLNQHYLSLNNVKIVAHETDIYSFYEKIYYDDYLDPLTVLKGMSDDASCLQGLEEDDIAGIYLFFDYDPHTNRANNEKINYLLEFFDSETDKGKLYISYPMVEAYKHPMDVPPLIETSIGSGYKSYVAGICDKNLVNVSKISRSEWDSCFKNHIKAGNFLINGQFVFPLYEYFKNEVVQTNVLSKQVELIDSQSKILVISAFSFFLLDYFGESLSLEWSV